MNAFEYRRASSSAEALALAVEPDSHLLAGGTDLLPLVKDGVERPQRLVDIKRAHDLPAAVEVNEQGAVLGALATLADLARHEQLRRRYPLLAEALAEVATPQLREMATLGGNLLQRPRCWYFRQPQFHCWLAGGEECPARAGQNQMHAIFDGDAGNPCRAVHPSDLAPCLVALDAEMRLRDAEGRERRVPAAAFFQRPEAERRTETVLGHEALVDVQLPPMAPGCRSTYRKAMARRTWAFALVGVAVRVQRAGNRLEAVRLVLSGVDNVPRRAHEAEALLDGAVPSRDLFEQAAEQALAGAAPLAHNGYKVPLARGLIVQALEAVSAA